MPYRPCNATHRGSLGEPVCLDRGRHDPAGDRFELGPKIAVLVLLLLELPLEILHAALGFLDLVPGRLDLVLRCLGLDSGRLDLTFLVQS
jgi:hypothetical protein